MASTVYKPFRDAVAARVVELLTAASLVRTGFEVVPGRLEGPMQDFERGSFWLSEVEEDEDNVDLQVLEGRLRVFLRFYERRGGDIEPFDPAPLEEVAEVLQAGLRSIMTSAGPWFFRVTGWELLLEEQGVELGVRAWMENLYPTV